MWSCGLSGCMCLWPHLSECLEHSDTAAEVGQTGLNKETLMSTLIRKISNSITTSLGSLLSCASPSHPCTIVHMHGYSLGERADLVHSHGGEQVRLPAYPTTTLPISPYHTMHHRQQVLHLHKYSWAMIMVILVNQHKICEKNEKILRFIAASKRCIVQFK